MTSPLSNRATTLKEAFQICDVRLSIGKDIPQYYVDLSSVRKTEAIEGVSTALDFLEPEKSATILFTGHRGCGKTTELKRIQEKWKMVNIYNFNRDKIDLDYNEEGLNAVASLIEKRVNIDAVFQSRDHLLELAKASGGHVRQLMQMMRTACLTASTRGHENIQCEDAIYAIKQEQFNFERSIPLEHYPILAEVYRTKDIEKNEIGQSMLFNTSVLEYNGNSRWNYINPVVRQSDAFQQALNSTS